MVPNLAPEFLTHPFYNYTQRNSAGAITLQLQNTKQKQHMRTRNKLTVTNLTHLAFHVNSIIDSEEDFDLSFSEIHEAAELGRLLEHLEKRFHGKADLYLLTSLEPNHVLAIEKALQDAADVLRGRERRKADVKNSGLCLLIAIILEALQQNFSPFRYQPESETEALTPASGN